MKITGSKSFGEAVRKRRKKLGHTQDYLSRVTGLSVSFISDLERGKETIELEKALQLANLLGLNCALEDRGVVKKSV